MKPFKKFRQGGVLLSSVSPPRQAKNWLHVNIGQSEARQLRALAECWGCELRTFLRDSILAAEWEVARKLRVKPWDAAEMTRARRREIAQEQEKKREKLFLLEKACGWKVEGN